MPLPSRDTVEYIVIEHLLKNGQGSRKDLTDAVSKKTGGSNFLIGASIHTHLSHMIAEGYIKQEKVEKTLADGSTHMATVYKINDQQGRKRLAELEQKGTDLDSGGFAPGF